VPEPAAGLMGEKEMIHRRALLLVAVLLPTCRPGDTHPLAASDIPITVNIGTIISPNFKGLGFQWSIHLADLRNIGLLSKK
jgi:hypothetical protein